MGSGCSRHRGKSHDTRRSGCQSSRPHRTCPRSGRLLDSHRQIALSGKSAGSPRTPARASKELVQAMLVPTATTREITSPPRKKPFYTGLSFQVLVGVGIAIILGYVSPARAV